MSSRQPKHWELPLNENGSFIICTECCLYVHKEENEISRHIKRHHEPVHGCGHPPCRLRNPDGGIIYNGLLRIPQDVARVLSRDVTVDGLIGRSYTGINPNPKSRVATPGEIVYMAEKRGQKTKDALPARYAGVVATTQWPPR